MLRSTHINKIKTILFTNDKYCKLSHFLPIPKRFCLSKTSFCGSESSSSFVNLGKGTKTKHILSSKQMAARSEGSLNGKIKRIFKIWAIRANSSVPGSAVLHPPSQPPPLPEHALCSTALCPVSCQSCQLRFPERTGAGVPAKAKLQLPAGGAFWFSRAGFAGAWSSMMPTLILRLDSARLHCLSWPQQKPSPGGGPAPPSELKCKIVTSDGRGGARPGWVAAALLREEARISLFSDWDKLVGEERVLSTALSVLNLGRERTSCPLLQATPSHPLCLQDPLH